MYGLDGGESVSFFAHLNFFFRFLLSVNSLNGRGLIVVNSKGDFLFFELLEVETDGVDIDGVEVETDGVDVDGVEVKTDGVDVDGVEVETDGVDVDGVEVETDGVDVDGVDV